MSAWEFFTWLAVAVLAAGSLLVFAAFLRRLPQFLKRPHATDGEEPRTR